MTEISQSLDLTLYVISIVASELEGRIDVSVGFCKKLCWNNWDAPKRYTIYPNSEKLQDLPRNKGLNEGKMGGTPGENQIYL